MQRGGGGGGGGEEEEEEEEDEEASGEGGRVGRGVKWTHDTVDRFGRARLEERLCELTQPWDSHSLMQRLGRRGRESVLSASSVVTSTVLARPPLLFTANNHRVSRRLGPN